ARARLVQRGPRRGLGVDEAARRAAARRLRGGDPARRDARLREALPAQLRRVPVPLRSGARAGAAGRAGAGATARDKSLARRRAPGRGGYFASVTFAAVACAARRRSRKACSDEST